MSQAKTSLISRIHGARGLSASQRRIADCVLGQMNEAAFWGVEELAARGQSSVATVVRFAQKLGYSGFLELRQALVAQARRESGRGEALFQAPAEAAATLLEVATRDVRNIEAMVSAVNESLLQEVVAAIRAARHRCIIGRGVSLLMGGQLGYLLTQAGFPTIEGSPADFASQAVNLGPEDLLIALSFPPYSTETLDAAEFAAKRGIPVLAFTDRLHSPLARNARHVLPVPGENLLYSRSMAAFSVLSHSIATALASTDRAGAIRRLHEAERIAVAQFTEDE